MKPGDRLVCAFVGKPPTGPFKQWPLHVTIVPWFRVETDSHQLTDELQSKLTDYQTFMAEVGRQARFGHGKTVNLINSSAFNQIEPVVRELLKCHQAWLVDETTKRQRPFRPHVTAQATGRLHAGDSFSCSQLQLVEQFGDHKKVVGAIELGHG